MAMTKDPAFVAEAKKMSLDLSPIDGEAVRKVIAQMQATPPDVIAQFKEIAGAKIVRGGLTRIVTSVVHRERDPGQGDAGSRSARNSVRNGMRVSQVPARCGYAPRIRTRPAAPRRARTRSAHSRGGRCAA